MLRAQDPTVSSPPLRMKTIPPVPSSHYCPSTSPSQDATAHPPVPPSTTMPIHHPFQIHAHPPVLQTTCHPPVPSSTLLPIHQSLQHYYAHPPALPAPLLPPTPPAQCCPTDTPQTEVSSMQLVGGYWSAGSAPPRHGMPWDSALHIHCIQLRACS
jgi:hypothetical protein